MGTWPASGLADLDLPGIDIELELALGQRHGDRLLVLGPGQHIASNGRGHLHTGAARNVFQGAVAYPVLHIAGDRGFELLGESLDFHGALDRLFSGFGLRLYGCIHGDRKSTRLNSSHLVISYAVFCLKKKKLTTASSLRKTPLMTARLQKE